MFKLEKPADMIACLETLVKELDGPEYSLSESKLTAKETLRFVRIKRRLEDAIVLIRHDLR